MTTFRHLLNDAKRRVGLSPSTVLATQLPFQPLLISIVTSVKSGCSKYYRLLRRKACLNTNLCSRENKWHQELGYSLSREYWNRTYKLTSEFSNDNRMKWLQFQINRNSVFTNYKIHKFNRQVAPTCTFCIQGQPDTPNLELVSHLFVNCDAVNGLWTGIRDWLCSLGFNLPIDKTVILFGWHDQPFTSVINYIILTVKYYIWVSRLQNQILNLKAYKKYLFSKLDELKNACIYEKKEFKFDQWLVLYNSMLTG